MERSYSFILLALVLVGSIVAYVAFATPFALRIVGANFGSTTVYVHVSYANYGAVQGATVHFIGMSSTGQALTTTHTTDSNGDASAGLYGVMWDSTVEGSVRVVYSPSGYDQTRSVYGQSGSTTTIIFNDVPTPQFTLTITSSSGGSTNPSAGTTTYQGGSIIYVTATPQSGYKFDYWLLDGANAGSTNPIKITFDKSHTLSAVFSQTGQTPSTTYQLTVSASAGGSTNPSGTSTYSKNQIVTATATANEGYKFDRWQIDSVSSDTSNPIQITMDKSHTLNAEFTKIIVPTYDLTVVVKDQVGNELQSATVDFVGKNTKTTDDLGVAKESFSGSQTVTVKASFTKSGRTFELSKTVTVDQSKTETLVINRQFHWDFDLAYTNGTKANGVLTLKSATKNVTENVADGKCEAWLDNDVYTVYFKASPQVQIGTLAPVNDGSTTYSLTPTGGSGTTTTSTTSTSEPKQQAPFGEVKLGFPTLYLLIAVVAVVLVCVAVYVAYSFLRGDD